MADEWDWHLCDPCLRTEHEDCQPIPWCECVACLMLEAEGTE